MFTGIIQTLGQVLAIRQSGAERRFSFRPLQKMENLTDGESIAVNGVCLSVEAHGQSGFSVYASGETMQRSNLGELKIGSLANLERALKLDERLGGHLVSGHVDCLATVVEKGEAGQSIYCGLSFSPQWSPQVIAKGSIALNGISLTVNKCGEGFLEVNVIPDSQKRTNFSQWRTGDKINMETDLIGKYVESFLLKRQYSQTLEQESRVNLDFLRQNGFI